MKREASSISPAPLPLSLPLLLPAPLLPSPSLPLPVLPYSDKTKDSPGKGA